VATLSFSIVASFSNNDADPDPKWTPPPEEIAAFAVMLVELIVVFKFLTCRPPPKALSSRADAFPAALLVIWQSDISSMEA
jgi:hypothetical protein